MRSQILLHLFVLLSTLLSTQAASLAELTQSREAKLEASLTELNELRETIQQERLPLAQKLQTLDAQAEELENQLKKIQGAKDKQQLALSQLRTEVEQRQRAVDYITRTLMPGYFADLDADLSMGQRPRMGERIRQYNLFLENKNAKKIEQLRQGLELLADSIPEIEVAIGGQTYSGEALAADGSWQSGTFIQLGPLLYFASKDTDSAGLIDAGNQDRAEILPLEENRAAQIHTLAREGEGSLPLDFTQGAALAVAATKDGIGEHLEKGGTWVYPILFFALVATIISIYKAIQIFTLRHPRPLAVHEIVTKLRAQEKDAARATAKRQPKPASAILTAAVEHSDESLEMVEEVMYEAMLTVQPRLERFLNLIAVTAAAAPLLGLLGTVTGIIKTFRLMTVFGAGDPAPLISGISEALITTELGLILAIPALIMHALLARKVSGTMAHLEKMSVTLVNGLARRKHSNPELELKTRTKNSN